MSTARERFHETMRYGHPDRVPYFEEGLRDDVLERWHEQGLPKDADLAEMFHTDRRERIPVDVRLIPELKKWPTSRRGLKAIRRRLDLDAPGRFPEDWRERVKAWAKRDHVLELPVHRGFFLSMGVGGWDSFARAVYQLKDSPSLVREIMDMFAEFGVRLVERVLSEVEIDFASFSEPTGGNDGPLVSPQTYEELVLSSYQPIMEALRERGVETIVLVTFANARPFVRSILNAGFDCLWACEVNAEAMDYRSLRAEFGPSLRLIGGIDLDTLLLDKEAIRQEIETKAPPLLEQGGYIPLADGRVRANVPFENYAYYRRLLEKITQGRPSNGLTS